MYRRILVPTDGSALAGAAASAAVELARVCGAEVIALSVAYPEPVLLSAEGALASGGTGVDVLLEQAQRHVMQVAEMARRAGVPCAALTAYGESPSAEIVALAARRHCDLVFIASHGRHGLSRLIAGSVTQQVLARSPVPVLVYRPGAGNGKEQALPGPAPVTRTPA